MWDYPRPPRLERTEHRLRVHFGGEVVADTRAGYRVLETSHPPVYYLPPEDVRLDLLEPVGGTSFCEWKGIAGYWNVVVVKRRAIRGAWSYPRPVPKFEAIANHFAFHATMMDECLVGEEAVVPQPGGFYGGWITGDVVGPFKGSPGSAGW